MKKIIGVDIGTTGCRAAIYQEDGKKLGLGIISDIKEVTNLINIKERYYPNEENHKRYQQLYGIYERVYWNLQKEFEEISEIQRTWKN